MGEAPDKHTITLYDPLDDSNYSTCNKPTIGMEFHCLLYVCHIMEVRLIMLEQAASE